MDVREFENIMKSDIEEVFTNILAEHNYLFPISARSRSGAEISDYLEDSFVEYLNNHPHIRIYNPKGAPKGATKNPYDFCFNYKCEEYNYDDLIWGDIKATKFSYADSNPDLGTPEKIIKFIMDGHFYLMFVFLEYDATEDNQTKFRPFDDGRYVHCQFLKDINHTVRINPKPQFQVNINEPEEYRTREEFLELFYVKYQESIDRIIEKQTKKKAELDSRFDDLGKRLLIYAKKITEGKQ
ncbi:hypothetical protein DXC57_08730 [Clostridium sp. TF06-15AC]|jgi:hypothetical protein|uniref:Restriction endonuclease n=1 Tax=Clostridium segne TaxID=2763038 RepID=A0AAW3X4G0_9CLOT|nr:MULTISPECIES: hypothetical protein [Clostridium]MBC5657117.1 hypothetical protein [Clostridium segne]RHU73612.1 hypothetical protein DXC57_08730 [Clostridium sp. TF06-15AC]